MFNLLLQHWYRSICVYLKKVPQVLLFTELLLVIDRKILTLVFLADFELRQDREIAFVSFFVDVHEMAMNRQVLSVEARSPQLYYGSELHWLLSASNWSQINFFIFANVLTSISERFWSNFDLITLPCGGREGGGWEYSKKSEKMACN